MNVMNGKKYFLNGRKKILTSQNNLLNTKHPNIKSNLISSLHHKKKKSLQDQESREILIIISNKDKFIILGICFSRTAITYKIADIFLIKIRLTITNSSGRENILWLQFRTVCHTMGSFFPFLLYFWQFSDYMRGVYFKRILSNFGHFFFLSQIIF